MSGTRNKPNEIHFIREYNAPLKMVWDAWTDPKKAAEWWGPRGFTITTHSKDFRTGGTWDYTMHGPDGTDYPNLARYREVVEFQKMVYEHGGSKDTPYLFLVTVLFSESNGKTKMDMTMAFENEQKAKEIGAFIKQANGYSTWDRFAEYLEKKASDQEVFVINRSFAVGINKMYDLWTDPKHFAQWLPPTGATMKFIEVDVREGGTSFYEMPFGQGMKMYGKVKYEKLQRPDLLQYTQWFCNQDGSMGKHPMAPTWPATMFTTVILTSEDANQTRVTVRWAPDSKATREEMNTFIMARAGMSQGWGGSFEKLDAYIATL